MTVTPPDELDLLAFFEAEPALLDPATPWIYNTAIYETERDGYSVRFEISPSYSTLKVTVTAAGRGIADAEVTAFTSLEIAAGSMAVSLCADPNGVISFRSGRPERADSLLTIADARRRMTYGALSYSGGGGDYVRVRNGRYSYVVYSAMGRGWEQEGLVVEKDGRRVSAMRCDSRRSALGPRGWASVYAAHLPNDTLGFNKPD